MWAVKNKPKQSQFKAIQSQFSWNFPASKVQEYGNTPCEPMYTNLAFKTGDWLFSKKTNNHSGAAYRL
jgi:hypothetical protein